MNNNMIAFWLITFSLFNIGNFMNSDIENKIDLIVEYEHGYYTSVLQAYKSQRNEAILKRNETSKFDELKWYSIGEPTLSHISSRNSSFSMANLFEITPLGFNLLIEFLTDSQKELFKERVKSKYRVDIETSQIQNLIPTDLKCTTKVLCSNGTYLTLYGEANDFERFPLRVEFDAPMGSEKIECFEHHLIEYNQLDVDCVIRKKSNAVTFSISWKKYSVLNFLEKLFGVRLNITKGSNLLDKIFGNESEVYVTREQMVELASEIKKSTYMVEEYYIYEEELNLTDFVNDITKQKLRPVPIDTVLKSFSKYTTKDFDPNMIKRNLLKVLKVKTIGDKKYIIANPEYSKSDSEEDYEYDEIEKPVEGVFNASLSFNYVKEKERGWENSGISLDDQLKELNSYSKDNIEWELEGENIVPKNLKVNRILRASFNEELKTIKGIIDDYILDIQFSLRYKNDTLYERIANKSIDNCKRSIFLNSIKTSSLIKCIEACEDNQNCHYAQFLDNTCSLFKKTANLFLKVHSGKQKLYLYERISQREPKEESPSVESRKFQKLNRYEKFQISGFFLSLTTQSEEVCWNECMKISEVCIAISYGENRCHLVKKGEYQLRRFNNWVSIYIESEDPFESENPMQYNSDYSLKI